MTTDFSKLSNDFSNIQNNFTKIEDHLEKFDRKFLRFKNNYENGMDFLKNFNVSLVKHQYMVNLLTEQLKLDRQEDESESERDGSLIDPYMDEMEYQAMDNNTSASVSYSAAQVNRPITFSAGRPGPTTTKICTGQTSTWFESGVPYRIITDVDISKCNFSTPPVVLTYLTGKEEISGIHGINSILNLTRFSFRLYLTKVRDSGNKWMEREEIVADQFFDWEVKVNWVAFEV